MTTIGILPAAGHATRINGLPKYLLPIPGGYLLDKNAREMQTAGVDKLLIGANHDNDDLLRAYAPPDATVYTVETQTMSETVLRARKYAYDADVLFGMPDTWFRYDFVYSLLQQELAYADASVAMWKIRDNQRGQGGQCLLKNGQLVHVIDKDLTCNYPWIWGAMAWTPKFWQFIKPDMPHIGYALQPAIDAGLNIAAVPIDGSYYDCGTAERYFELAATFAEVVR